MRKLMLNRYYLLRLLPILMFLILSLMIKNVHASNTHRTALNTNNTALFPEYTATYELRWHGINVGKSVHTLREIGQNHYEVESKSFPNFTMIPFNDFEKSEFIVNKAEIKPLHYHFRSQNRRKKMVGNLNFDWKNQKITKVYNDNLSTLQFNPPIHDKMSQFFQLRYDLQAGKKILNYSVEEPKGSKPYHYQVIGKEPLKTPIGTLNTIIVENAPPGKERKTKLWLAEDMGYIMVKLVQIRKGKITAEATIQQLSLNQ